MGAIRGMMATSLDGFAADAAGGVGWLAPFEAVDWGYGDFIAEIGTVVLGRRAYEQLPSLAPEWPYPGQAGIVVGQVTPPLWGARHGGRAIFRRWRRGCGRSRRMPGSWVGRCCKAPS